MALSFLFTFTFTLTAFFFTFQEKCFCFRQTASLGRERERERERERQRVRERDREAIVKTGFFPLKSRKIKSVKTYTFFDVQYFLANSLKTYPIRIIVLGGESYQRRATRRGSMYTTLSPAWKFQALERIQFLLVSRRENSLRRNKKIECILLLYARSEGN